MGTGVTSTLSPPENRIFRVLRSLREELMHHFLLNVKTFQSGIDLFPNRSRHLILIRSLNQAEEKKLWLSLTAY